MISMKIKFINLLTTDVMPFIRFGLSKDYATFCKNASFPHS